MVLSSYELTLFMLLTYIGIYHNSLCHQDKPLPLNNIEEHQRIRRDVIEEHMNELLMQTTHEINHVAHFSGHEIIRHSDTNFNIDNFTIEFWMKLEGGQYNNAPILTIYNHCSLFELSAVLIGLKEEENSENGMKIYFSLQTQFHKTPSVLYSHLKYEIDKWFHVAAVYDGEIMSLFVNQAKVDVSHEQSGPFLSNIFHQCTTLEVGGDSLRHLTFRGAIDDLRIWNIAKHHQQVFEHVKLDIIPQHLNEKLVLSENFSSESKNSKFYPVTGLHPEIVKDQLSRERHDFQVSIPECGRTACDNPKLIKQYINKPKQLLKKKIIRYRLINIAYDDGSNPMLTLREIKEKDKQLNTIFSTYNISFKLVIHMVDNSFLRNKTVTLRCHRQCADKSQVCKTNIQVPKCTSECTKTKLNNKKCDPECNSVRDNWDNGDCCNPLHTDVSETCFDPKSRHRAFIKEDELKTIVNLPNDRFLNIFPVKLRKNTFGKATFPWTPTVYSKFGGTSIYNKNFKVNPLRKEIDLIHELGHIFGLWHVHKGVSDLSCDDPCAEQYPSMTHGDLCDDTFPTPENFFCRDEVLHARCGNKLYTNTPYRNFMGSSTGRCADHFTPQQQARMHCYIDRFYQRWQPGRDQPSPIPYPPRIIALSQSHVTLTWFPPVGIGKDYIKHDCNKCNPHFKTFKQFASAAYSPHDPTHGNQYQAEQAVGAPNVESMCLINPLAWLPPPQKCQLSSCYIELSFEVKMVPTALKIWVVYNALSTKPNDDNDEDGKHRHVEALRNIVLLHTDGTRTSLGAGAAHCHVPYTKRIKNCKTVEKIRIYVRDKVAIDAVQMISEKNHDACAKCKQLALKYDVYRTPVFNEEKEFETVFNVRFSD